MELEKSGIQTHEAYRDTETKNQNKKMDKTMPVKQLTIQTKFELNTVRQKRGKTLKMNDASKKVQKRNKGWTTENIRETKEIYAREKLIVEFVEHQVDHQATTVRKRHKLL